MKRNWVWAYICVKLVEIAAAAVVIVGGSVITAAGMDTEPFVPFVQALIYAAFIWETVYCLYRVIFLYEGERFRIPMTLLIIPSIPGWYALFSRLTGIENMAMEVFNLRVWVLPYFMPLIAILLFFYDINIMSRIDEKRRKKKAANM